MASNSGNTKGSSAASRSEPSFVDASGYKFSEKDRKATKLKVKKNAAKPTKQAKAAESNKADSGGSSPILPVMDEKTMSTFPTGNPRDTPLETVICKHCRRPVLKQTAAEHIRGCLKNKQEKARKKKEARDAKNAKEKADKEGAEDDGEGAMKGQKSAKKNAGEDGPKKGKKRKAEEEDKEPKKKKKKDEPKPKIVKPKGPVDVEKQCGVLLPNGGQCARSLTCKSHSMGAKRAVPGRSLPYDMLLQAYQKKNQARQQKAAIDANAPVHDDLEGNGPIDSDEEKDAVMAGLTRSRPQPMVVHPLVSTRKKYHLVRMKEMLSQVLGTGNLFSPIESNFQNQPVTRPEVISIPSPSDASPVDTIEQEPESPKKTVPPQQAPQNRAQPVTALKKVATTAGS